MRFTHFAPIGLLLLAGACASSDPEDAGAGATTVESSEPATTSSSAPESTTTSAIASTSTTVVEPETSEPAATDRSVEAAELATSLGAARMVVTDETHSYLWSDGGVAVVELAVDQWVWADEQFVYLNRTDETSDGSYSVTATVLTYAGDTVCELDEGIHHLTKRDDGTYVAGVEGDIEDYDTATEVPMFAVDCVSKERQAIEAVNFFDLDGEWETKLQVGARSFRVMGDAEGNASILNESGASINGEDYSGYHTFNLDGSRVAYGDMTVGGPHFSNLIVGRDTTTTVELWRIEVELAFIGLGFVGNDVLATQPIEVDYSGMADTASVVVIDGDSGAILETIPTTFTIVYTS